MSNGHNVFFMYTLSNLCIQFAFQTFMLVSWRPMAKNTLSTVHYLYLFQTVTHALVPCGVIQKKLLNT